MEPEHAQCKSFYKSEHELALNALQNMISSASCKMYASRSPPKMNSQTKVLRIAIVTTKPNRKLFQMKFYNTLCSSFQSTLKQHKVEIAGLSF